MTQPADQRPSSYTSLRSVGEGAAAGKDGAAAATASPDNPYWKQEAEKLDALLQSLWSGYVEAPSNGLPTVLADYVSTYTAAMRLRLMLSGYATTARRTFKAASPFNGKSRGL